MKKLFFVFMAMVAMTFAASCSNGQKACNEDACDSTAVDTLELCDSTFAVDSVEADSVCLD